MLGVLRTREEAGVTGAVWVMSENGRRYGQRASWLFCRAAELQRSFWQWNRRQQRVLNRRAMWHGSFSMWCQDNSHSGSRETRYWVTASVLVRDDSGLVRGGSSRGKRRVWILDLFAGRNSWYFLMGVWEKEEKGSLQGFLADPLEREAIDWKGEKSQSSSRAGWMGGHLVEVESSFLDVLNWDAQYIS